MEDLERIFPILSICDSWGEIKIPTLIGVSKKLIPALMDGSVDVVEIAREIRSGVWSCEWLAASHDKSCDKIRSCCLCMSKGNGFLRWDLLKIVEIDNTGLRILNLVDKAVARFEKIGSNFLKSSSVGKMPSNSTEYYRKIVHERKSQSTWQTCFILRNCYSHPTF